MLTPRSFGLLLGAACIGNQVTIEARSYSLESAGCLFELAKVIESKPPVSFALALLSPGSRHHMERPELSGDAVNEVEPVSAEFSATVRQGPEFEGKQKEAIDDWPLFTALKKWQESPDFAGLSHAFANPRSVLALDYSDIFETGRAPYRGSHGVSLFFRHKF